MNNDKKPSIRFKGFMDTWEQYQFDELANYKKGPFGSALTKDMFVPKSLESVKVYEQQNAINKNWKLERYFIPKEYANKMNAFEVHGGDIIVSCAGTIGEIYILPNISEVGIINQALMRIRVNDKLIDKELFIYLFSNMIDIFSKVHSNGSAIKNIPPFSDLKPALTYIPLREEQNKIIDLLINFNNLIIIYKRKCEKLKDIKKAMLEKMFPKEGSDVPEIRFKGFTDIWKQCYLNDITKITMGQSPSSKNYTNNSDDNILVQGNADMKNGCVVPRVWTTQVTKMADVGDLIISVRAPVGKVGKTAYKVVIGRGVAAIKGNEFIFQSIKRLNENGYWRQLSAGSTFDSINSNDLMKAILLVTNYKEETKIGEFFKYFDSLINLYQCKYEKLKNIKKAMLEKMFV